MEKRAEGWKGREHKSTPRGVQEFLLAWEFLEYDVDGVEFFHLAIGLGLGLGLELGLFLSLGLVLVLGFGSRYD